MPALMTHFKSICSTTRFLLKVVTTQQVVYEAFAFTCITLVLHPKLLSPRTDPEKPPRFSSFGAYSCWAQRPKQGTDTKHRGKRRTNILRPTSAQGCDRFKEAITSFSMSCTGLPKPCKQLQTTRRARRSSLDQL